VLGNDKRAVGPTEGMKARKVYASGDYRLLVKNPEEKREPGKDRKKMKNRPIREVKCRSKEREE